MKCALFVDFDNIHSGLQRLDPEYAQRFASQPSRWIEWLERRLELPPHVEPGSRRRLLVRRVYLNPLAYGKFRSAFNRAGFEIIDCPPMTQLGKTSTDIHMVLDVVDLLQHEVRYDEFIIFSADSDFSPLLRKLRRWDRRTTALAIGFPSLALTASTDLLINPTQFIRDGLEIDDTDDEEPPPSAPDRRTADESPSPGPASRPAPPAADSGTPQAGLSIPLSEADAVVAAIRAEVFREGLPVPCSRIAQLVHNSWPAETAGWRKAASFRRYLESLPLAPFTLDWNAHGGYVLAPGMTAPQRTDTQAAEADIQGPHAALIVAIHDAIDMPKLSATEIRAILSALADDVAVESFLLTPTSKRVRDVCREQGHAVSRADVSYVLTGLRLAGHDFDGRDDDVESLGRRFADNIVRLCARDGLALEAAQQAELQDWVRGH